MIRYVFRDDEPLKIKGAKSADAQKIGEALADISARYGDGFTPHDVLEEARSETSVLHAHFTWDDREAAERYRLDEARSLVRCIRVADIVADGEPARAFLSISRDDGVAYHTISQVQSSADLRDRLLASADRDLEAFQKRHRALKEICEAVQVARDKIARRRRRTTESRPAA